MGSRGPITPVERTRTWSGSRPSAAAAWAAVANRVLLARGARRGVRDARVDHHRLRLGELEVAPRDDDRRRQHAIRRPHRAADRRHRRHDERDVRLAGRPDPRRHAGGGEPLCGGDRHQTSTPASRSPVVSENPNRRLTFCTA